MIGFFAIDEGMCVSPSTGSTATHATIRSFNTNTVAGVQGHASKIILDFLVAPAAKAREGFFLPERPQTYSMSTSSMPSTMTGVYVSTFITFVCI